MWIKESQYSPKFNTVGIDQRYVIIGSSIIIANKTESGSWLTDACGYMYGIGLRTCSPDYVWDSEKELFFSSAEKTIKLI